MPHNLNFSPLFNHKAGKTLRDFGCHSCVHVDFFLGYDTVSIGKMITSYLPTNVASHARRRNFSMIAR